ncbi:hypothetical protein SLS57_000311 [Botryosphaeria dothidea]
MSSRAPPQHSCFRGIRHHQLSPSCSPLLYLWLLSPAAALPQTFGSGQQSSDDDNDNNDGSSLDRDGMLNLYFLFIAIAVILLLIALFLIHRRKKRRKAMMRTFGQSALAQDISNGGPPHNQRSQWYRWGNNSNNQYAYARTEGLNERGEAPPPYGQPPGGPPQPYAPPPHGHFAPLGGPPPPHQAWHAGGDPAAGGGLAIPMRTLSRDTQGNKPPEYGDTLTPGDNPISASSSTGNLIRHDGRQNGGVMRP